MLVRYRGGELLDSSLRPSSTVVARHTTIPRWRVAPDTKYHAFHRRTPGAADSISLGKR